MVRECSTFAEVRAAVAALPAPPAGTVRVFRGQTTDYPSLAPSGLRREPRARVLWHVYSGHLYAGLTQSLDGNMSLADLQAHGLWFKALSQHYGPGSDYLDVTYSLESALWFALHKSRVVEAKGSIGPPGPPDPARDHPTSDDLIAFEPWSQGGVIYVFDLPLWSGEGLARPGSVIDLARAPEMFASSPRMRAQSGCLIYCRNADSSPLDVRKLLVPGTPLHVRRPMTGAPGLDRPVADMFPSPAVDPWYARLLSVPMAYSPRPSPPTLRRQIPVTVYHDPTRRRYTEEVHFHDVAIEPALIHREIPELARRPADRAAAPTVILLEAPMIHPRPPGDSKEWHHGLLWTDLPDRCPEYDLGGTTPIGTVALDDVLFELSPLENIGWERVIQRQSRIHAVRAVRIQRGRGGVLATVVRQELLGGPPSAIGVALRYDPASGLILASPPTPGSTPVPLSALEPLAKPILIALMLLRTLSSTMKCEATPTFSTTADGVRTILIQVARDAARLHRVATEAPNPDWFVLRDASNGEEPFTHVTHGVGSLTVTTRGAFGDVPLEDLRGALPS